MRENGFARSLNRRRTRNDKNPTGSRQAPESCHMPLEVRTLGGTRNPLNSDFENLSRLKALSWLSASELESLAGALAAANFKRSQVILGEAARASDVHILLKGIARITYRNAGGERATIALIAPGPIPKFPLLPFSRFSFQCEAYKDCRVGSLRWSDFERIVADRFELVFKTFHANDLQHCYRMLLRNASFLNLDLHKRIAITLLELASDFGIKESRGALLNASLIHQDIADLVGASRPRVTEHLAQLEREHLIVRQGRQLIVCVAEIENAITIAPSSDFSSQTRPIETEQPFVE
jgi:CRP/FNR family transcriptional regulator, cyclic AMP receptor protein